MLKISIVNQTPLTQRQSAQAHNLGVTGSKPVGGILVLIKFTAWYWHLNRDSTEAVRSGS